MSASGRTLRQHVIGTFQCPSDRPDVIPHSEEFDTGPRGAAVCNFFGHAGHVGGSPGSMNAPCIHSYYETYRPFAGNGGFSNPDGGRTPNPAGVFARHGVPGDRKGDAALFSLVPERTRRKRMPLVVALGTGPCGTGIPNELD